MRVDTLVLFLIVGGKHSAIYQWTWYQLLFFVSCLLSGWGISFLSLLRRVFSSWKGGVFCQMLFASIEVIMCVCVCFFFILLIGYMTCTNFQMLNQPLFLGHDLVTLLDSILLVEDFCIYIHTGHRSVVFSRDVFIWFWHRVILAS